MQFISERETVQIEKVCYRLYMLPKFKVSSNTLPQFEKPKFKLKSKFKKVHLNASNSEAIDQNQNKMTRF